MNDFIKESSQNENICLSWKVIKRDGITEVPFEHSKIVNAIKKAFKSVNNTDENCNDTAVVITNKTVDLLEKELNNNKSDSVIFSVEEIQDKVEQALIQLGYSKIAKEYIVYREKRNQVRMMNSSLMQTYKDFVTKPISEIDEMRENANIDGQNPMGGILKFGSEASKTFVDLYLIKPLHAKYHGEGYLHVHDKDFYTFRTTTCTQIDIKSLLNRGFHTGHGFLRTPGSIISAAALACIAIQSNQADQHGGQSIPNLDYGLAPYVAKTYIKKVIEVFELVFPEESLKNIKLYLKDYYEKNNDLLSETAQNLLLEQLSFATDFTEIKLPGNVQIVIGAYKPYLKKAVERTERDTYQAMEAMVHNFNTLKSRSGGQVPFSSINFGTDTTEEGRMVSRNFLKAIDAGLGKGETSIFPVAIFQVKRGFNYSKEDPNYDLFELSCEVSSRRLFPNFLFEDSSFNKPYYKEGRPETLCAVMGCRTRVLGNTFDPDNQTTYGRGNLSFTTINLPMLALDAVSENPDDAIARFFEKLEHMEDEVFDQLLDRFEYQKHGLVKSFPTLMGQHIWMGSEHLSLEDEVGSILGHGTLTVGFIGLAETLIALTGKAHDESKESQELGLKIVKFMHDKCVKKSNEMKLNFSLIGTPAESTVGTMMRKLRKKYGIIPNVTEHEYLTNSFHCRVYKKLSIKDKIDIEAPYHKYCLAGAISYIELNGDPSKNVKAFMDIVKYAESKDMGYFSINHAVDRCPVCNYVGVIDDACPRCGFSEETGVDLEKLKELQKYYPDITIPKI